MIEVVFTGWVKGMRPLPFSMYLYKEINLSLREAWDIQIKITAGEVASIKVSDIDLAIEIQKKSEELGVIAEIKR